MSNFKVGDQVTIMPSGDRGYVKEIKISDTYPIVVYHSENSGGFEGSYTLNGFRFTDRSTEKGYYITNDVVASAQTTQPDTKTNPYWSIVKVSSLFMHLTHTADQVSCIIPTASITAVYNYDNSVTLATETRNYDLGPIPFDEVASLLFTQQQSNSI